MIKPQRRIERTQQSIERNGRRADIRANDRQLRLMGAFTLGGGTLIAVNAGLQMAQSFDRIDLLSLGIGGAFVYMGGSVLREVHNLHDVSSNSDNLIPAKFGQADATPTDDQPPATD